MSNKHNLYGLFHSTIRTNSNTNITNFSSSIFNKKTKNIYQPYLSLISSCKTLKSLLQIHAHLILFGLKLDNTISTHLINSYSNFKRFDLSRSLFDSTPNPRVILWNSMIRAYNRSNKHDLALEMYRILLEKKVEPDKYTFTFVLKACSDLEEGVLVHRDIVQKGLDCDVYIGTSLVDMYCEFGDLSCAKEVFDKMLEKDIVTWNAMIGGFSKGLDFIKAFDFFSNMELKGGVRPNSVSLLNLFPAVSRFGDVRFCRVLHGYVSRRPFPRAVFNGLIDIYSKCGCSDSAGMVFDQMWDRDDVSWGTMMAGCLQNGYSYQVLELFDEMNRKSMKINRVSITSSLLAAGDVRDLEKGKEIHVCAIEQGIDQDISVATPIMTMYARCGELEKAKYFFTELKERDIIAWSAAISAFLQSGYAEEALFLFREMVVKNNLKPNRVTLVSVIPACAELMCMRPGKSLHCFAIKFNIDKNVFIETALVSFYSRCRLFTQAIRVMEMLPEKDIVTWNALISGYAQSSEPIRVIEIFNHLRRCRTETDLGTVVSVIPVYSLVDDVKHANCIYGLSLKSGFDSYISVKNALIDMFMKYGDLYSAELLLHEFGFDKDDVSWNIMIAGYVANGHDKKAISTFTRIRLETLIKPNVITIISVLSAIGHLSDIKEGKKVHCFIVHLGFESNTLVRNSLISMYAKCGHTEFSERIFFKEFGNKDLISWNSLLSGYAVQGQGERAVTLFTLMLHGHVVKVDHVSFLNVLSACRHTGLVHEGREIFFLMIKKYGLDPDMEHYACMVDMFGRAGLFDEALTFINKMPIKPDAKVWTALLGACKTHSNLMLGEFAVEHLRKLEPENPAHYVVFSSLYSQCSKWENAKDMRVKIHGARLQKTPGCSWLSKLSL